MVHGAQNQVMLLLIYTLPSIVAARYERGVWHAAGAAPLRPRGVDLLLYALIRAPSAARAQRGGPPPPEHGMHGPSACTAFATGAAIWALFFNLAHAIFRQLLDNTNAAARCSTPRGPFRRDEPLSDTTNESLNLSPAVAPKRAADSDAIRSRRARSKKRQRHIALVQELKTCQETEIPARGKVSSFH